jgi:hypothetical protein
MINNQDFEFNQHLSEFSDTKLFETNNNTSTKREMCESSNEEDFLNFSFSTPTYFGLLENEMENFWNAKFKDDENFFLHFN